MPSFSRSEAEMIWYILKYDKDFGGTLSFNDCYITFSQRLAARTGYGANLVEFHSCKEGLKGYSPKEAANIRTWFEKNYGLW